MSENKKEDWLDEEFQQIINIWVAELPTPIDSLLYGYHSAATEYHEHNLRMLRKIEETSGMMLNSAIFRDLSWQSKVKIVDLSIEHSSIDLNETHDISNLGELKWVDLRKGIRKPTAHITIELLEESVFFGFTQLNAQRIVMYPNGKSKIQTNALNVNKIRFLEQHYGYVRHFHNDNFKVSLDKGARIDLIYNTREYVEVIIHLFRK